MSAVTRGHELELTIDSLAYGGRGVARHGELVVFVARALPGDRVRARVTKYKRRYAEARAVELLEAGPGPGGGAAARTSASAAAARGRTWSTPASWSTSRPRWSTRWSAWGGSRATSWSRSSRRREQFGYRNKLEYSWSSGPDGPSLGFHVAGRWDQLLPIDRCLHRRRSRATAPREAFERLGARGRRRAVRPAHAAPAILRHLVVREGRRTGDLLAVLVTAPGELPAAERLAAAAGRAGATACCTPSTTAWPRSRPACRRRCCSAAPASGSGSSGSSSSCRPARSCRPTPRCATSCTATPSSTPSLRPDDVVWDLYCGAGAIGLLAARHAGAAGRVEIAGESVRERPPRTPPATASRTPSSSTGDVSKELRRLLELAERPSVVFVDPPRAGLSPKAVRRADRARAGADRLRLAATRPRSRRTPRQLAEAGYRLERVRPVDMFPHTHHIECVARLQPRGLDRAGPSGPGRPGSRRPGGRGAPAGRRRRPAAGAGRE